MKKPFSLSEAVRSRPNARSREGIVISVGVGTVDVKPVGGNIVFRDLPLVGDAAPVVGDKVVISTIDGRRVAQVASVSDSEDVAPTVTLVNFGSGPIGGGGLSRLPPELPGPGLEWNVLGSQIKVKAASSRVSVGSSGIDIGNIPHSSLTGITPYDHHNPVTIGNNALSTFGLNNQEIFLRPQNANMVLCGPQSGPAGAPVWRALTASDIPTLPTSKISDFAEAAQDAIGSILASTPSVAFTYNDSLNQIQASVLPGGIDHNLLSNLTVGDPHPQYPLASAGFGLGITDRVLYVNQASDFVWTGSHRFDSAMKASNILPRVSDSYDLGSFSLVWRNMYVANMNATVFAENTAQLFGGYLIVPKSVTTLQAEVSSSATTITFAKQMTQNDVILIRGLDAGGNYRSEHIRVETLVSGTTYNVTRDLKNAYSTDPAWPATTPVAILGQTGDGRIELDSVNTPRMSIVKVTDTSGGEAEIFRAGDLNGNWGYGSQTYGVAIGEYGAGKISMVSDADSGLRILNGSAVIGSWSTDGTITVGEVGPSKGNVLISSGGVFIRNNTTERISLDPSGILRINNASGDPVFTFGSTGAEFAQPLSIGANGGIWQGSSGTFESPNTGLKIYQVGGKGVWETWNDGIKQVYIDPAEMTLKAAGGGITIGADGISLVADPDGTKYIHWDESDGNLVSYIETTCVLHSSWTNFVTVGKAPGYASLHLGAKTNESALLQLYATHGSYGTCAHINTRLFLGEGPSSAAGSPGDMYMSGNLTLSGTAKRIIGDFSNTTQANRVLFQTSTLNSGTNVGVIPNGTSQFAGFTAFNSSSVSDCSLLYLSIGNMRGLVRSGRIGSGQFLPLAFETSDVERVRIGTDGNVGIGVTAPRGRLHGRNSVGGFIYWEHDSIDSTATAVHPANEVSYAARIMVVVRDSSGGIANNNYAISRGSEVTITTSSGNSIAVRVNSDGSMDVRRTAGSLTFRVAMWAVWM